MKSLFIALALTTALLLAPPVAQADATTREAAARELISMLDYAESYAAASKPLFESMEKEAGTTPEMKKAVRKFTAECLSSRVMESVAVEVYANNFTEAELRETIAFYKTKAGKKWLALEKPMREEFHKVWTRRYSARVEQLTAELDGMAQTAKTAKPKARPRPPLLIRKM